MSQPRPTPTRDAPERARFFDRQLLRPADLNQDQAYFLDEFRRHTRLLHGWGIRLGLGVAKVPAEPPRDPADSPARRDYRDFLRAAGVDRVPEDVPPDRRGWVWVGPGYAVTPTGDRLYLPRAVFLNTTQERPDGTLVSSPAACVPAAGYHTLARDPGPYCLVAEGWQDETGAVRAGAGRCGDHPEQFALARVADTVRFRLIRTEEVKDPFQAGDPLGLLTGSPARSFVCLGSVTFEDARGRPAGTVAGTSSDRRDPPLCTPACPEPRPDPKPPAPKPDRPIPPWLWAVFVVVVAVIVFLFACLAFSGRRGDAERRADENLRFAPEPLQFSVGFDPRSLPPSTFTQTTADGILTEYGRYHAVHVWPDPGVEVTDDWARWVTPATFRTGLRENSPGHYSVEGSMMADNTYLYLGAHVRDPFPKLDRQEPKDPDEIWKQTSVQVYICTVPGYQVATLKEGSQELLHIQLWSSRSGEPGKYRARIDVYRGDRGTGGQVVHKRLLVNGYEGMVVKDEDGRGYQMKYRIPWAELGMDRPGEDQFHGVSWNIHWSDRDGKCWAKLTEFLTLRPWEENRYKDITSPGPAHILSYMYPDMWGKAVFHRK